MRPRHRRRHRGKRCRDARDVANAVSGGRHEIILCCGRSCLRCGAHRRFARAVTGARDVKRSLLPFSLLSGFPRAPGRRETTEAFSCRFSCRSFNDSNHDSQVENECVGQRRNINVWQSQLTDWALLIGENRLFENLKPDSRSIRVFVPSKSRINESHE